LAPARKHGPKTQLVTYGHEGSLDEGRRGVTQGAVMHYERR
jgi:hypothetical protein